MIANDELNDSSLVSAVLDSVSGLPMPPTPPLGTITARGRARRRHRLGALSVAGAGVCAALVAGLVSGWGSAGPASQQHATPARLTAFSVTVGPHGTTILTLSTQELVSPSAVRQALARHGIPVVFTSGKLGEACGPSAGTQPAAGPSGLVRPLPGGKFHTRVEIDGSAIPNGEELLISYLKSNKPGAIGIMIDLTRIGAPLTCPSA